jgi:hypothetical protein
MQIVVVVASASMVFVLLAAHPVVESGEYGAELSIRMEEIVKSRFLLDTWEFQKTSWSHIQTCMANNKQEG